MFKRANKITALLVAAASVMSIVPAMAADKLGTKDGTIDTAVAFKEGKYLYQGYRTDDDDSGLYYNAGDKDKKLDDASEIDLAYGKYDDKFVEGKDGSNDYIVDLTTGKISDDDTAVDLQETASTKLNNKLKKTDRYGNAEIANLDLSRIKSNRFGDVWYEYTATTTAGASVDVTTVKTTTDGAAQVYSGYTNQAGTYIDCSKDANIYVFNGSKMVKLESLGDTDTTGSNTVTLKSITPIKTLAQDDKYIYRLVEVHVDGAKAVGTKAVTPAEDIYYIQKISKAQGDKEKDAYLPKSTDSFQLGTEAQLGDGDADDAYKAIMTDSDSQYTNARAQYYVVDGSLYVTFRTGEKVKTIKMNLKTSQKLKFQDDRSAEKVDGHVVIKDTDKDQKIEDNNYDYNVDSFSIDVNGNVWAVKDGEVLESSKCGDFKTVYSVDRSFNKIDAYDDKDMIIWEEGGDAYTTVNEGKKQAQDDAGAIVQPTPAKVGWDKLTDGTWNFYDATGAKVVNNWVNVGGAWYFLKADGVMATGWQQVGGTWYYLAGSGAMATGWINDGGNWYYLNASGAMLANTTTPDGYYVGTSGAWVK